MQTLFHMNKFGYFTFHQARYGNTCPLADDFGDILLGDLLSQQRLSALYFGGLPQPGAGAFPTVVSRHSEALRLAQGYMHVQLYRLPTFCIQLSFHLLQRLNAVRSRS